MKKHFSLYESKIKIMLSAAPAPANPIVVRFTAGKDQPAFGEVGRTPGDVFFQSSGSQAGVLNVSTGEAATADSESYRIAASAVVKWLRDNHSTSASIDLMTGAPMTVTESVPAVVEGLILGDFRFEAYKSDPQERPNLNIELQISAAQKFERLAERAEIGARAACMAREWAHEPANVINPITLAERAQKAAEEHNLVFKVLDDHELELLGANALLAVGKGSKTPPRMILLEYPGRNADAKRKPIVLVGKAITFDTGGYSIKGVEAIKGMKYDKSAGVDVIAILAAASELELDARVVGIIGAAENSIAGDSYKPDDIIKTLSGKTVEIATTDAEGRLVLADCLAYAQQVYEPELIIDMATLTSAIVTSLGRVRAGLFCNDDALAASLSKSGDRTHELLWRMPLDEAYLAPLKSDDADLKNGGAKEGPSIAAAVFLKQFVDPAIPWAHLDIDGVATTPKDMPYCVKGATGFGVRLLTDFLENRA